MEKRISPYLYILPALIIVVMFRFIPIALSFVISFFQWDARGIGAFIGLTNYQRLFGDADFWQSMLNTVYLVLFVVPLSVVLSLFFANLLNQIKRLRGLFRTTYFLPTVTSLVAISIVWKIIYNNQSGLANHTLKLIGFEPLRWLEESRGIIDLLLVHAGVDFGIWMQNLSSWLGGIGLQITDRVLYMIFGGPSLALFSIIILTIWKSLGYNTIIYLAGLQNIPQEFYEAASIDGAGKVRQFFGITLPLISPTTFYVLMMTTITTFQVFSQVYLMTGPPVGGPMGTTKVIVYYIFDKGFGEANDYSYASAIALVLFAIILSVTLLQRRLEKRVHY